MLRPDRGHTTQETTTLAVRSDRQCAEERSYRHPGRPSTAEPAQAGSPRGRNALARPARAKPGECPAGSCGRPVQCPIVQQPRAPSARWPRHRPARRAPTPGPPTPGAAVREAPFASPAGTPPLVGNPSGFAAGCDASHLKDTRSHLAARHATAMAHRQSMASRKEERMSTAAQCEGQGGRRS